MSPLWTATRQPGFVAFMLTSQETGPAGSQYLASERKRWTRLPFTDGARRGSAAAPSRSPDPPQSGPL